jgi:D-glycero-alpha-D-manno-heptose-7-phosphate kinase
MIITRTPFRISFAGGGSDLEACYAHQPGAVLCTAIDKYMYLAVKEHFGNEFRVSYSKTEYAPSIDEIQHPIVRECLRSAGAPRPLEIVSMADLPAQAGMGSSSSFTVGLLHALYASRGEVVTPNVLAEEACRIEIDRLGEPIGKQDQYIAAYGGLQFIRFHSDGRAQVEPVLCSKETYRELDRRLLIFFTGLTRNAREVLTRQNRNTPDRLPVLAELCRIAERMRDVIAAGDDLDEFGHLLHEAWDTKKRLEASISTPQINDIYLRGLNAGALGGKLLGAGGGGFLLFYCEPARQVALREEIAELREVPFGFSPHGTRIVHEENPTA